MEIEEEKYDPELNFENLVRQVEEQSEFCDVTIKVGDWTRKFHRCVLSASILFQIIITAQLSDAERGKSNVIANSLSDGEIEMKINISPDVVEMAIMFLYGISPDFKFENIGAFLELAEYLKIKELKDACIDWLNDIDFSDDEEINCINVICLSRRHHFEIPSCIQYIESHIPEILKHVDAIDLPTDLIVDIFKDGKFSYVDMDDKLNYLVKLANKQPTRPKKETIVDLFNTIHLSEVSETAWQYAENNEIFSTIVNLRNKLKPIDNENTCVMIIPSEDDYFACLDLQNDIWYRLNSSYFEEYSYYDQKILRMRNNEPKVYFKYGLFSMNYSVLTSVDLVSDQVRRFPVIEIEHFIDADILDMKEPYVNITNDETIVVTVTEKVCVIYEISVNSESECESDLESRNSCNEVDDVVQANESNRDIPNTSTDDIPCTMQAPEICIDEPSTSSSRMDSSDSEEDGTITYTDVYIGHASDIEEDGDDHIGMRPIFSFRKEKVVQVSVNDLHVMALLTKARGRMHVIVYDLQHLKMERIFSVEEEMHELCAADNGFLLHNNIHCYCLTKEAEPAFRQNTYKIEKFELENKEEWFVKYHYQCGIWMRVLRRSEHNDNELQYISHEALVSCYSLNDLNWTNVSMPEDKFLFEKVMKFENIFIVQLSKRKLRCNIKCPHCKYLYYSEMF